MVILNLLFFLREILREMEVVLLINDEMGLDMVFLFLLYFLWYRDMLYW